MASNIVSWQSDTVLPVATGDETWYALHTRPRHEKLVVQRLEERGVETFLPIVTEVHKWSDRKKASATAALQLLCVCQVCPETRRALECSARRRAYLGWSEAAVKARRSPTDRLMPSAL